MFRLAIILTVLVVTAASAAAGTAAPETLKDLYFGEALYYAFQDEWFDAIARLDAELALHHGVDEPRRDSLYYHIDQAEFAVGDFELAYRMHQRAGRAISAVIEGNVPPQVRNEAIFRLARIYFQKDQPVNALYALERLHGEVPESIRDDLAFLRAQILMANSRFAEAADILETLQAEGRLAGFSTYNLGIALIRDGDEAQGRRYLDKAGQIRVDDPVTQAIRDKSNLVLGAKLLEERRYESAKTLLDRVRLSGPFSNRALLGSGWADASRERFDSALVPWNILLQRQVTDASVQEAMIAVPFAYGKLHAYAKAAKMYSVALEKFGRELDKLDASIESIQEGHFLEALVREELKQDANWVVKLRELPATPETYYLLELMTSHDFQESLKNYLDLEQLRKRLVRWQSDLDAFEQIIAQRRAYYEPLLPEIDREFRRLDSQMRLRLGQRDHIAQRMKSMLVAPRPDYLTTSEERIFAQHIAALEAKLTTGGDAMANRVKRLKGVLLWQVETAYDQRFTDAYKHLKALDKEIDLLKRQYTAFVRTRQAATQSYEGYSGRIDRQRTEIQAALQTVAALMARQGGMLETMAVNELSRRRERLAEFQIKARFAMADSYDRATRIQVQNRVGHD